MTSEQWGLLKQYIKEAADLAVEEVQSPEWVSYRRINELEEQLDKEFSKEEK